MKGQQTLGKLKCMKNRKDVFSKFLEQVAANKETLAIITSDQRAITYQDLLNKVNEISNRLLEYLKAKDKIAILMEPSIDFVALTLACLKLGVAYIPLNTTFPYEYINNILIDSQVKIIFVDQPRTIPGIETIFFRDFERNHIPPNEIVWPVVGTEDDAYIIYTSGSTGVPKGVIISNESIVALIENTKAIYHIGKNDRIPLAHSLAFDFSVWEIFVTLLNGATLVIPSEQERKALDLYATFLQDKKVTVLNSTPALLYLLIDQLSVQKAKASDDMSLRLIILGGEALKPTRLKKWFNLSLSSKVDIYNMYGITEGTIHSTYLKISRDMSKSPESLIGVALPHVTIDIVSEGRKKIIDSEIGEMCLLGCSVATGYLNHPELTKEKFFVSQNGQRGFRTGDLVKKHPDGNIEYMGRKNHGVKIRGFRVDPSLAEKALLNTKLINDAVVSTRLNGYGQRELVAFLIPNTDKKVDILAIKKVISSLLPEYMIPGRFMICERLPITVNGKVDFKELSVKLELSLREASENITFTSKEEELLLAMWKKLLERNNVGIDENFFDAGGNSLLLMQLHFEIQKTFGLSISLMDLIEHPTINKFLLYLHRTKKVE